MKMISINESDIEAICCPLCESNNKSIIHTYKLFKVVLCKECGLAYLDPRLKESVMKRIYQGNKYFLDGDVTGYRDYISQEKSLTITFRRFLREIEKHGMTSGRLLEVGCGYGYFLTEAKNFFSYISGAELSAEAGTHAQQTSGVNVHIGDISSMPPEWNNFDTIVTINVIEHIYAPIEFLLSVKQRLKGGGRIVIATPDIGSFWYKIMGKRWPSFKIPEHVAFYTRRTLKLLLKIAGFDNIKFIPFHHAFPIGLIAYKLGISVPKIFAKKPVWLPKTMVAMTAENHG